MRANMSKPLQFLAEVKEVKSKKLVSLDVSYNIVFNTDDPAVLQLGALGGDALVKVTVEIEH